MNKRILIITLLISMPLGFSQAESSAVSKLLEVYTTQGAATADAEQGKKLWQKNI